ERTGRQCQHHEQQKSARTAVLHGHRSNQGDLRAPGIARARLSHGATAAKALNDCGLRWSRAFNPQSAMSYLTTRCEYCRKFSTTSSNSSPAAITGSGVVQGVRPATGAATSVTVLATLR